MNILLSLQEACQLGKITSMNVSLTLSLLCPFLHFYFHIIVTRANAGSCSVFICLFFLQRFMSLTYEYVKHACRLKSVAVLQLLLVCHTSFCCWADKLKPHGTTLCRPGKGFVQVMAISWSFIYLSIYLFYVLFILQNDTDAVLRRGHRRVASWLSSLRCQCRGKL